MIELSDDRGTDRVRRARRSAWRTAPAADRSSRSAIRPEEKPTRHPASQGLRPGSCATCSQCISDITGTTETQDPPRVRGAQTAEHRKAHQHRIVLFLLQVERAAAAKLLRVGIGGQQRIEITYPFPNEAVSTVAPWRTRMKLPGVVPPTVRRCSGRCRSRSESMIPMRHGDGDDRAVDEQCAQHRNTAPESGGCTPQGD